MQKKSFLLLVVMSIVLLCFSNVNAANISISKKNLTLNVEEEATLKVKGTKNKITWSSSDKSVATVSKKGKVIAKSAGTATITAKVGNKKLKCKVTVKTKYGKVSGNITYLYNKFRGNVSDTGATVILIPTSGKAKNMPTVSWISWDVTSTMKKYNKYDVYTAKVDGQGNYKFNRVPVGEYKIIVVSKETTDGSAFDDIDSYYIHLSNQVYTCLKKDNIKSLSKFIGYKKFEVETIDVYEDDDTDFSHDFGVTYI